MKLWKLELNEDEHDWDRAHGFVVRAPNAKAARKIVTEPYSENAAVFKHTGAEGPEPWLDPKRSSCVEIQQDGPAEVLLRDFNAG